MRQRIRAILEWAVTRGYRTDNPAGPAIHGELPKRRPREHQKRHHPAVPYSELPQVIVAACRLTSRVPLRFLLEFVVLTAVRSGEGREAQWSEFDFATATWVIPGTRMKTGFPHRVPLSDRVLEILREMRALNSGTGLVFPGVKGGRPFSDSAMLGASPSSGSSRDCPRLSVILSRLGGRDRRGHGSGCGASVGAREHEPDGGGLLAHRFARGEAPPHAALGGPRHFSHFARGRSSLTSSPERVFSLACDGLWRFVRSCASIAASGSRRRPARSRCRRS